MFRRSSSERTRRLVYRTRPTLASSSSIGVHPSSSSPSVAQKSSLTHKPDLPLIRLEESGRDEDSDEGETDERTRLMSHEQGPGLLRNPSADDDDDERLQSVHISVPEFPIAT